MKVVSNLSAGAPIAKALIEEDYGSSPVVIG